MSNLLLQTDCYKFGHKDQYPPGTNKVYSYMEARGSRVPGLDFTLFFGLNYYLKKYLKCPTHADVDEWVGVVESILGKGSVNPEQMRGLADLGYLPIRIKAVPEGTVVAPLGNALMTITNTHPDYAWLVNYLETLLMKLWCPITVASNSLRFRLLFEHHAAETCDDSSHVKFQMHDFGYRGVSSEESAAIAGAAHLTSFLGTDTTAAVLMLRDYYGSSGPIGLSVPASEHSVMCAWSPDNDDSLAIQNMLETYPTGIVSIVSDSYDLWNAIENLFGGSLKSHVLLRDGKTVIRPDSGDPVKIICGNPDAPEGSPERLGVVQLLDKHFGSLNNTRGYKVLNPKVGCIYGDAITYERADEILSNLRDMGFASSNVVFGSGGLLLNNWSRDTLKMAIKATYCEVHGKPRAIEKNPITDPGKKSKKGLLQLRYWNATDFMTFDERTEDEERTGLLSTAYLDGELRDPQSLDDVRNRIDAYVSAETFRCSPECADKAAELSYA